MVATTRVAPSDRFKRRDPCPICEGGKDDKPHKGIRCTGYRGTDPRYVFCSRVTSDTPIMTAAGQCWRHWIGEGACHCGKTHVLVPASGPGERPALALVKQVSLAPPKPINRPARLHHGELGTPVRVFEARRADGALMALHARLSGRKRARPSQPRR